MEPITEDVYCIRSPEDLKLVRETLFLNADEVNVNTPIEYPVIVTLVYDSSHVAGMTFGTVEYLYQSDLELFLSYLKRNGNEVSNS